MSANYPLDTSEHRQYQAVISGLGRCALLDTARAIRRVRQGYLVLVGGVPGAEKTVLVSQLAFHLASRGERVLMLSSLSETSTRFVSQLSGVGFYDPEYVGNEIRRTDLRRLLTTEGSRSRSRRSAARCSASCTAWAPRCSSSAALPSHTLDHADELAGRLPGFPPIQVGGEGPYPPVAAIVYIEDAREHGGRVEPGQAQPVDRALARDQRRPPPWITGTSPYYICRKT